MTHPEDAGVVKALATSFMQTLGANIPAAVNFFTNDATVNWNDRKASGKAQFLELFKSLPVFKCNIATCDCQRIASHPGNVIVVLTGILETGDKMNRFHSSFFVERRQNETSAIKSMTLTYCPDPLPLFFMPN